MAHRFFLKGSWQTHERHTLEEDEARHAVKVLRLSPGDKIEVFNGEGALGVAVIEGAGKHHLEIQILNRSLTPRHWRVSLGFSLGKPAATEFILRRVAELGVESFQPLITRYSQPGEFKRSRWERILGEVCKQCQELNFPKLFEAKPLEGWLSQNTTRVLLCDEQRRLQPLPALNSESLVTLLVGSEGGWHPEELTLLESVRPGLLGLGANRLRAETAALAGAVLAKHAVGEL